MIKSKRIDSFFKRKACDEIEKIASTSSKIEKLHKNPNIEEFINNAKVMYMFGNNKKV